MLNSESGDLEQNKSNTIKTQTLRTVEPWKPLESEVKPISP